MRTTVEIEGRRLSVSSLDRVLYPQTGFTKGELIDYYVRIAPALLPHLRGRPVTLRRFPEGVEAAGWYQHECPPGSPVWVATRAVTWPTGTTWDFCAVDDVAALAWLANLSTVELHPFFLLAAAPEEPTAVVFDLDPGPPAGLPECCRVALRVRELLERAGLGAAVKVSGALGVHVVAGLAPGHTFAEAKAFARTIAAALVRERPAEVVDRQKRDLRVGKVLVDWLQNDPMRSTVAPYSPRAYGRPTVSAPISWEEVERGAAGRAELVFEPVDVLDRVDRLGDLFAAALERTGRLPS